MYSRMCPLWPLHLIILYLLALGPLWVLCQSVPNIIASFHPMEIQLNMGEEAFVQVVVNGTGLLPNDEIIAKVDLEHIASAQWNSSYKLADDYVDGQLFSAPFKVHGNFLGRTDFIVEVKRDKEVFAANGTLPVIIVRPSRVIDKLFTSSVAIFVSLIFINFGCAMHWPTVKEVLIKPVGPIIGMCGQFLFMPLLSFGLSYVIFPNSAAMRLGMFCTGVSPAGGASNIWTFILGGNLNLSLAMTSICTLASFAFMPAWLFSLGQVVFGNANILVPYQQIAYFVVCLIVPLAIGLAMQRFTPRIAAFMVRILKAFSTTLLLFIIVFAIITNLYIFELFTWQIIVAGMGIPWLGYVAGYLVAIACKQSHPDALAISIETGIQNTGIAIFLLRYALPQPEADLTTVVPVSVAIMTPIPMTMIYIYQKIKGCLGVTDEEMSTRKSSKISRQYQTEQAPASMEPLMSLNKEA
ncbi:ileal sodium/bile acid cotransporter isoform X3 [Pieris rapae]|uniref:ileal sodium/bile acid cotransporter isoform X3 n=1 Tax=Pieris rapae TaxID=64459 RepID=UPI001E27B307|nr:ileal sodium/bile acid cotransporter isoform X3 [Pieris rapae]